MLTPHISMCMEVLEILHPRFGSVMSNSPQEPCPCLHVAQGSWAPTALTKTVCSHGITANRCRRRVPSKEDALTGIIKF